MGKIKYRITLSVGLLAALLIAAWALASSGDLWAQLNSAAWRSAAGTALGVALGLLPALLAGAGRRPDSGLTEMARSYGLAGWPLYRDVTLPAALPSILRTVRVGLGLAWLLLIATEAISAQTAASGARMLLYLVLGCVADLLVRAAARHFLRWHPDYR
ncbi:putative aliphatic sulfonates transport permease protein SsuC [Duganella sp. HH105]|nr:putative aliphatic sulfonates transport permease protein SsuC [Duganella sp. HH105]